jgi:hypothetical protein
VRIRHKLLKPEPPREIQAVPFFLASFEDQIPSILLSEIETHFERLHALRRDILSYANIDLLQSSLLSRTGEVTDKLFSQQCPERCAGLGE